MPGTMNLVDACCPRYHEEDTWIILLPSQPKKSRSAPTHSPATSAYEAPAVIYEAPLEVRAGTPFEPNGLTGLVDLGE